MSGGRTFKVIFDGALSPEFASSVTQVSGKIEDVGKKTTSTGDKIVAAMRGGSVAVSGAGVAVEAFARSQQDMNVEVGQTAAAIGISTGAFRELATSVAGAGLPLDDVVPLLKLANQEGLQGERALAAYAGFWDDVGDATGDSAVELAKGATGLRAVGIAAGEEGKALAAFGFITDHTKLGVDDFLGLLQRKGANLKEFGISIDDTAAILGVMEKNLGLTGKAAATEFASALEKSDGSMGSLLKTLGITTEQFDTMRTAVDASSGVIERNAKIQDDTITATERWKNKLDELLFSHADMVKSVSDFAPLMMAVGPAVNGAAAALGAAKGVAAGLGDAMHSTAGKATILAAGLGGVALAADVLLQKTTGRSLTDWVIGDVAQMDRAEKALQGVQTALLAAGAEADKAIVAEKGLAAANALLATKLDQTTGGLGQMQQAAIKNNSIQKNAEEQTRAWAKELLNATSQMKDGKAATEILQAAYNTLDPSLRQVFESTTHVREAYDQAHPSLSGFGAVAETVRGQLTKLEKSQKAQSEATMVLAGSLPRAQTAAERFAASIVDADGKMLSGAKAAKGLDEAIKGLTQTLAANNPEVLRLTAANIALEKEMGDLQAKGESLTAADKARIEVLGGLHAANDKVIADHAREQQAVEGLSAEVKRFTGPEALGGLLTRFGELKVDGDKQAAMLASLTKAFGSLETKDIPGALRQFEAMKATLDPAEWSAIAEAIGPALVSTIGGSINGPDGAALIGALRALGSSAIDGLIQGIADRQASADLAIRNSVARLARNAREEAQSHSPSEVFARLGEDLTAGLAIGIHRGGEEPAAAMTGALAGTRSAVESRPAPLGALPIAAAGGGMTVIINGDWHASDDARGRITRGDISYFLDKSLRGLGSSA